MSPSRPLIGVTTSEVRYGARVRQTPKSDPPQREMALGLPYLRAIEAAGGLPVVMPPLQLDAIDPLLERLTGICLSGGPDLDPETYHESPHPELGPTEPGLDRFELELARRADGRGLPILAICRGMQTLNVARDGSLHQHLPDRPGVTIDHRRREGADHTIHEVTLAACSRLARTMGRETVEVNSFHHQGVDRLGNGLRAVAWAPDGVIEGLEAPASEFCVAVQWHAETLVDRTEQARLFRGLVDASARFAARDSRGLAA